MIKHFLAFEKQIADLEGKIEELRHLSSGSDINIAEEIGKLLVQKLPEFKGTDQDELVEILCGRLKWANFLLEKIKKEENLKSSLSPYHAMQIKSFKNENLNIKLDEVWGVVRQSPEYLSNRKKELKEELRIAEEVLIALLK